MTHFSMTCVPFRLSLSRLPPCRVPLSQFSGSTLLTSSITSSWRLRYLPAFRRHTPLGFDITSHLRISIIECHCRIIIIIPTVYTTPIHKLFFHPRLLWRRFCSSWWEGYVTGCLLVLQPGKALICICLRMIELPLHDSMLNLRQPWSTLLDANRFHDRSPLKFQSVNANAIW